MELYHIATGQISQKEVDIRKNGIKTEGIIVTSEATGNIINGCGELVLKVKVTRPDGSTFEASAIEAVSQKEIKKTVPGSAVRIYYMPDNERDIAIGFYD